MQDAWSCPVGQGQDLSQPAVGAVVVKSGRIVGRGFHRRWGSVTPRSRLCGTPQALPRGQPLRHLEPCYAITARPRVRRRHNCQVIRRVLIRRSIPIRWSTAKGAKALRRPASGWTSGLRQRRRAAQREYFKHMRRPALRDAQGAQPSTARLRPDRRRTLDHLRRSRRMVRAMHAGAQALVIGRGTRSG